MQQRNHHIAILLGILDSQSPTFCKKLYPNDGGSFGLNADFTGALTVYDARSYDGESPDGLVTSLHHIDPLHRMGQKPVSLPELEPVFSEMFCGAIREIQKELKVGIVPSGFNGEIIEYAGARVNALRLSLTANILDGKLPVELIVRDFRDWLARQRAT